MLVAYLNLGKSLISRSLNCGIDTFQGCRDFCDLRCHQGIVLMRNEVVGNFKGGEKQKSPAMELLKQRVETWILARKNHIDLDKVSSTIGSQKVIIILSLSLSLFFVTLYWHIFAMSFLGKRPINLRILFLLCLILWGEIKKMRHILIFKKNWYTGTTLVVQWLKVPASNAGWCGLDTCYGNKDPTCCAIQHKVE